MKSTQQMPGTFLVNIGGFLFLCVVHRARGFIGVTIADLTEALQYHLKIMISTYSPPIISLYNLTVSGMGLAFSSLCNDLCNSA
jgi:hypothetical protein